MTEANSHSSGIEVRELTKSFGNHRALRGINLQVAGGEFLTVFGPNGAGKTTLLRACAGLQPPTRGQAFVMGHPVLGGEELVRHHIGFAPDAPPA
ncbi:MAG: ATP-binding cassette domain-containing protein, partial [Deltaproteobacteria bacterium]|nr:ATP-binding cassette domain-containing protein [Deltaproteobacteria bacterium]